MIVGIDVSSLARDGLTGIGVYIKHLVSSLSRIDDVEVKAFYRWRLHAKREMIAQHLNVRPIRYVPFATDRGLDVFHGPDLRVPRLTKRSVVTVHDLAAFEPGLLADDFARRSRARIQRLINGRRPDRVIAVSAFTAERLSHHFPSLNHCVDVVHLGHDPATIVTDTRALTEIPPGPFILFLGTIERRKNVLAVVEAFELLRQESAYADYRLVIAGGDGFDSIAIHRRVDESPHRDAIVRLGFVDDAVRAALYRSASAFIYPSLYEGFGLPVLEAMSAGCAVVTSNTGALAEVAGDAAVLVSPDARSIANATRAILGDSHLRQSCVDKGRARASTMTWDDCARRTHEVYRKLLDS